MPGEKKSTIKVPPMSQPDLKHRDWVLKSQQALIANIDNTISTRIIDTDDGGKRLLVFNISEASIQNLLFLTNTDQNNNYLYLEEFNVTIQQDLQPLEFPGLSQIMIKIYETSDANAFLNGSKTQKPFTSSSFNNGQTINEVVDTISSLLPFVTSTYGKVKTYDLVLNPDSCSTAAQRQRNWWCIFS